MDSELRRFFSCCLNCHRDSALGLSKVSADLECDLLPGLVGDQKEVLLDDNSRGIV